MPLSSSWVRRVAAACEQPRTPAIVESPQQELLSSASVDGPRQIASVRFVSPPVPRTHHRLVLNGNCRDVQPPNRVVLAPYQRGDHHDAVRSVYAGAFDDAPWPEGWDRFARFDPQGGFVAAGAVPGRALGFCASFSGDTSGYISVVAVLPEHRPAEVASARVSAACTYLRGLGLAEVKVDAFTDSPPVVRLYERMGFTIESTFPDTE